MVDAMVERLLSGAGDDKKLLSANELGCSGAAWTTAGAVKWVCWRTGFSAGSVVSDIGLGSVIVWSKIDTSAATWLLAISLAWNSLYLQLLSLNLTLWYRDILRGRLRIGHVSVLTTTEKYNRTYKYKTKIRFNTACSVTYTDALNVPEGNWGLTSVL
jgi:hypothetical protein